jgi:hypothetical protein
MYIEPELDGAAIVLLGSFNPRIFQPSWMSRYALISDAAAENAQISVIHPDISVFNVDSQFSINVQQDRFSIDRSVAPLVVICDLVCRIFGDLLPHTPLHGLGINRMVHFDVGSFEERSRIGRLLAPIEPWGEWGMQLSSGDMTKQGGLQSLTMVRKNFSDRPPGHVQCKIEPSIQVRRGVSGIYMEVNDDYRLSAPQDAKDASEIVTLLASRFDASMKEAEAIIDQIMRLKS